MLELDGYFFGRKKECVVAGISGGEPPWAHEAGGAPRGVCNTLDAAISPTCRGTT